VNLKEFFVILLLPNLALYLKILFFVALVYGLIYIQLLVSKVEIVILAFCYFGVVFSTTIVIFLYFIKKIDFLYYCNFIITTILFYFILFCFNKTSKILYNKRIAKQISYNDDKGVFIFSLLLIILYIGLNILRVILIGIRTARIVGGGTGSIIRLLGFINPLLTFSVFYIGFYGKQKQKRIIIPLYIISFCCFSLFSISKSAFLSFLINLYIFMLLNMNNKKVVSWVKKMTIPLLILGLCGGILVVMLMTSGDFLVTVSVLLNRFVAFGDVYIYAYLNNNIEKIEKVSFFRYLLADILRTFRLVDLSFIETTNIPGKLMDIIYGLNTTGGPNPRFNIIGYAFFGIFGSFVFSLFCAFIFVIGRLTLLSAVNSGFRRQLLAFYTFTFLVHIEQDALVLPQFITSGLLFLIFMCTVDLCINYSKPISLPTV
jgi:hypothetical protein